MGRPPKLTEELLACIVETLRLTANMSVAAARARVEKHTLYKWRARGSEESHDSDIYRRLWLQTEAARAEFIFEGAATFHKYSKGGLIVEPKRRVVYDNLGRPHELRELERDENGKIVEEEHFIPPDLKQLAWELSESIRSPIPRPESSTISRTPTTSRTNGSVWSRCLNCLAPFPTMTRRSCPKKTGNVAGAGGADQRERDGCGGCQRGQRVPGGWRRRQGRGR